MIPFWRVSPFNDIVAFSKLCCVSASMFGRCLLDARATFHCAIPPRSCDFPFGYKLFKISVAKTFVARLRLTDKLKRALILPLKLLEMIPILTFSHSIPASEVGSEQFAFDIANSNCCLIINTQHNLLTL